jgi:hypothetical protein
MIAMAKNGESQAVGRQTDDNDEVSAKAENRTSQYKQRWQRRRHKISFCIPNFRFHPTTAAILKLWVGRPRDNNFEKEVKVQSQGRRSVSCSLHLPVSNRANRSCLRKQTGAGRSLLSSSHRSSGLPDLTKCFELFCPHPSHL